MDSAKLNDWLQVVGLFGVIASLLFVGLQMKQDREIALSAISQSRTETTVQHLAEMSANDIHASAMDKQVSGEPLLPSEEFAIFANQRATMFIFENLQFQYVSGFVVEERWTGVRQNIKFALKSRPSFRAVFESNPAAWRESFQQVMFELIREIDAEEAN